MGLHKTPSSIIVSPLLLQVNAFYIEIIRHIRRELKVGRTWSETWCHKRTKCKQFSSARDFPPSVVQHHNYMPSIPAEIIDQNTNKFEDYFACQNITRPPWVYGAVIIYADLSSLCPPPVPSAPLPISYCRLPWRTVENIQTGETDGLPYGHAYRCGKR